MSEDKSQSLYEALEALCDMWEQYCSGEWGHMCMSAGENCEEVLDKHGLLIPTKGYGNDINYERLKELKAQIPSHSSKEDAAISLLREYEQWEADIIACDEMWWPKAPKDVFSGKLYEKFIELQGKRNNLFKSQGEQGEDTGYQKEAIAFAEWIREKEYEPYWNGWVEQDYGQQEQKKFNTGQLYQLFKKQQP